MVESPVFSFIILAMTGSYDDIMTFPVLSFSDEGEANRNLDRLRQESLILTIKLETLDLLMADWEKNNPMPQENEERDPLLEKPAFEVWGDLFKAEKDRLVNVIFGNGLTPYYSEDIRRYHLVKVPHNQGA